MDDIRHEPDTPDEQIFSQVRAAVAELDSVPPYVLEVARSTFRWRWVDDELARLTYDSEAHGAELAGVRGPSTLRLLTFESDEATLDLQIVADKERRAIIGEISPRGRAEVQVVHPNGTSTLATDEQGRFRIEDIVSGSVSLRCRLLSDDNRVVATGWLSL